MVGWPILLILIGEVFVLTKVDRIAYGTWITPFSLLAVPYTIIVLTAFFLAPALGFIPLYAQSVLVWEVGLLLFWLGGLVVGLPLSKTILRKARETQTLLYEKKSEKLALVLAWIAIFVMSYGLFTSLKSLGWLEIASDEFAKSYGYGWVGHFRCLSMGLIVFLIGTAKRRNIFRLITIFILIVLCMMYPVKSWVIIPVLAGFMYRFSSGRFRPSIPKILFLIFLVLVIFFTAYLIDFGLKNVENLFDTNVYEYLSKHFAAYIFAGVLAFGEVVRTAMINLNSSPHVIFAPFVNLCAVISSGHIISPVTQNFSVISLDGTEAVNVHTFFGTILINLGYFSGVVYVVFVGTFVYGLFALAKITVNCWARVPYLFIGAMMVFGWFEFYFWHLAAIEVPIYCAILGLVLWVPGRRYWRTTHRGKSFALTPIA